jgi:hypothetical protein
MNNVALRIYSDVHGLHKNIREHHYLFIIEKQIEIVSILVKSSFRNLTSKSLTYKMKLCNFKYNFSKFQHMKNNFARYTFCYVFVIITQWLLL